MLVDYLTWNWKCPILIRRAWDGQKFNLLVVFEYVGEIQSPVSAAITSSATAICRADYESTAEFAAVVRQVQPRLRITR